MDELLFLKLWALTINDFEREYDALHEKDYPYNDEYKNEFGDIFGNMQKDIEKAYDNGNKRRLKQYFKEDLAYALNLNPVERKKLNERLRAVCGEDLTKYDKRLANSVQRIVKRGKIRNGNEYEKVRTYIDSIEGEPEHEALLQDLYRMTGDFESAVGDDPSLIGEEWK